MNPYDAHTHPGEHLVAETLGVCEVSPLNVIHYPDQPLYGAATRVMEAAYDLDRRHDQVMDAGKDALRLVEPVAGGNLHGAHVSYALLRTALPELGGLSPSRIGPTPTSSRPSPLTAVFCPSRILRSAHPRRFTSLPRASVPVGTTTGP
ncbi:hypothetical protein [Streptomyces sp. NPDC090621]|uniref:hypothetical protein n=1 Tax=Streptomyces sp. NPDC090621 TaxID=3365966 RepID=UPI003800EABD